MKFLKKYYKILHFLKFYKKEYIKESFLKKHSTSPPCGNLADGLPHDCHTETVAKPGRLGPAKNGNTPL